MKKIFYIKLLILTVLFNGCGGSGSSASNNPPIISSNAFFVDINNGSNNNIGKKDKPFKTISYALSKALMYQTIYVAGGMYDENSGEEFPLILNYNKIYNSSENNKSIIIQGSGEFEGYEVSLVLKSSNTLEDVIIKSNNNIGVLSKDGNSSIVSTILTDNKIALSEHNNSKIDLINSYIMDNSVRGVELNNNSSLELYSSIIENSYVGINIADSAKILSGSQNSKIINNEQCDFFSTSDTDMNLQGIEWDENITDFNIEKDNCVNGNNIVQSSSAKGTIVFQHIIPIETNITESNISFYNPNDLTFQNSKKIDITQPKYNQRIEMTNPTIKYKHTSINKYIMVTIWKDKPNIQANRVQNPKDIVWYWHTGMDNSGIGYVEYHKGSNPINGKIDTGIHKDVALKELTSGRSYYLVIWEWDEKGQNIIASSPYSIFHVR